MKSVNQVECEEEQLGGDWEVAGQLGGEVGNTGMEGCDCVGEGRRSLLLSSSALHPSLTHSRSRTLCSEDKEVRTPLAVSKTPDFDTHLKWLLCLRRRIVVSISSTEIDVFYTSLQKTCLKLTIGNVWRPLSESCLFYFTLYAWKRRGEIIIKKIVLYCN